MLFCMHNDLIGEFEMCPTAKDMWDQLKICFGQTSEIGLHTLKLKWIQYKMDSSHIMADHLRIMSAMICDLRATDNEISKQKSTFKM